MPYFGQRACAFGMAMVKAIEDHYANFLGPVVSAPLRGDARFILVRIAAGIEFPELLDRICRCALKAR
jgi:hypothetical protein